VSPSSLPIGVLGGPAPDNVLLLKRPNHLTFPPLNLQFFFFFSIIGSPPSIGLLVFLR